MRPPLTFEELRARHADADLTVVDVNPAASYAAAHVPGAVSLPLDRLEEDAPRALPDRAAEIGVYCAGDG